MAHKKTQRKPYKQFSFLSKRLLLTLRILGALLPCENTEASATLLRISLLSREKDVKSTVSVLNEIGVGGLSLEVATDNEAYLLNLMQLSRLPLEEHFRESSTGQRCRTCCGDHERLIGWLWKLI